MADDPKADLIERLFDLAARLNVLTILKFILAGVSVAIVWNLVRNADTAVPALLANQMVVICAAAGIALGLIGMVLKGVAERLSAQADESRRQMQERIDDVEDTFADYKAETRLELKRVRDAEAACGRRLARMERLLARHGIEPPTQTGFGEFDG